MARYLENTVSALVSELAAAHEDKQIWPSPSCENVIAFVFEQLNRMPWFLRYGIGAITCIFGLGDFWRGGSLFVRKGPLKRRQQVQIWRLSRLRLRRDLIKFYAALVVFAWYASPEVNPGEEVE